MSATSVRFLKRLIAVTACMALIVLPSRGAAQTAHTQLSTKEKELEELNKKIEELKGEQATSENEAASAGAVLRETEARLNQATLELEKTQVSIADTNEQRVKTEDSISLAEKDVALQRERLAELVRLLYLKGQTPILSLWLAEGSLSRFLSEREAVRELERENHKAILGLKDSLAELTSQHEALAEQQRTLRTLASAQSIKEAELDDAAQAQAAVRAEKEEEAAQAKARVAEAEAARKEIEAGIFELKQAGVSVQLTDANDMAEYASSITGVRPALILAVIKVESNGGQSIGTGSYPDDMHPASREPFVRITAQLGLDPYTTPVSRRPRSLRGWGGAMGPAQIMPQTWEGLAPRLIQLTGKSIVNPYELADAMVATAVFLADRGAADAAREREAVGRYLAGPNWQYHSWYIDRVLAVAAEYEK